ncbi:MAG: hypothetical protein ABSG67_22780, partial [Thermoguttaceae bacterium]
MGNDRDKSDRKASKKRRSPLLKNAGFFFKEKYHLGERRYVNLGFMLSVILGPALEPGVSALPLQSHFSSHTNFDSIR